MATVGGFSRHKHLDELDEPLQTAGGVLSPSARRALVLANIGITATAAELNIMDGVTATAAELNDLDRNPSAITASADGTGTGAIGPTVRQVLITSAAATNQAALPGIAANSLPVGHTVRGRVTANGVELITLAASNETINGVDSDGSNQLDIPAQGAFIAWVESATGWALVLTATATPDND